MLRLPILLALVAVVTGLVLVFTMGTLLGLVLIIGGVAGLGWSMAPEVIDRLAGFLSTGSLRRR